VRTRSGNTPRATCSPCSWWRSSRLRCGATTRRWNDVSFATPAGATLWSPHCV
jgi:hypothetical protein